MTNVLYSLIIIIESDTLLTRLSRILLLQEVTHLDVAGYFFFLCNIISSQNYTKGGHFDRLLTSITIIYFPSVSCIDYYHN